LISAKSGVRTPSHFPIGRHEGGSDVSWRGTGHAETAAWTAQRMVDALPGLLRATYLLYDRDPIYADAFRQRVKGMGIVES
jgi:hypothetical protein